MYTINKTTAEKRTDGRRMKQRSPKLKLVSWEIIDWKRLCHFFKLNKSHIIDVMFKTYDYFLSHWRKIHYLKKPNGSA